MSFSGNDLISLIEAEVDDDLIEADVNQNVNSCLIEFADDFRKTAAQTIVVSDAGIWIERTSGHLSIVKITADGNKYVGKVELNFDRTNVKFGEVGTYVVTSIVAPDPIISVTDVIGVNDVFKIGMARYIGGCFKLKDNDMNPDGMRMKSEGSMLIKRASALLAQGDRRQGQRVPIRR